MNDIKILNDTKDFRQQEKSELYINIFGEEPRNEGYKCTNCEKMFGLSIVKEGDSCACNGKLEKFYDPDEVTRDRGKRAAKEGYIGKLAENLNDEFIGFIMGRETNIQELNAEKLGLTEEQINILKAAIRQTCGDSDLNRFFYGAELGVKKEFRGKGIASKLYQKREQEIKKKGINTAIIRTTRKTEKPYKWYLKEGFQDIFSYNDEQDRVIMIKKFL